MNTSESLRHSASQALKRFPGVLIAAVLATGTVIHGVLTEGFNEENPRQWMLLLTCLLGISWLYSLSLIAERRLKPPWKTAAPLLVGAVTLALYYFRLSHFNLAGNPMAFGLEVAGLAVALHLFAAYAPFLGFRQPRAFWEYNRAIFLRFLLALLFSATLLLGITLILSLLSLVTRGNFVQFYQFIFSALILGIFNTWFFLAGVPEDFNGLETQPRPYSRGLKVFAQFVLLPLTVAIGSLLAIWFLQRILSGSPLDPASVGAILALGAAALLTYLLLFPLEDEGRQRWLRIFRRAFFGVLLPFLLLFLYQAWRLVQNFGWTPPRYYGLILLAWGAALSLYLVLSRRPHIVWIPVTLSLLALATLSGPWSAVPLARASQNRRLSEMLGGPLPLDQPRMMALSPELRGKLESQVGYLENNYGCEELKPYFGPLLANRRPIDTDCSTIDVFRLLRRDAALPPEELEAEVVNINFSEDSGSSNKAMKIRGYDLYFASSSMEFPEPQEKSPPECPDYPEARPICVLRASESYQVEIFLDRKSLGKIDLEPMVAALLKKHASEKIKEGEDRHYRTFNLPASDLSFETRLGGHPARIDFEHLRLEQRGQRISPEAVRFSLLFQE